MADEEKEPPHHPLSDIKWLLVGFALLLVLWWANGGPKHADLRGVFINPPPPVGNGAAYGPTFGEPGSTTTVPQAQSASYGYQPQ